MQVQPYLFFEGRCEEAAEFYKSAIGAEVEAMLRFRDNPEPNPDAGAGCGPGPGNEDKVMHMSLRIGDTVIMASDGRCSGQASFQGFSLSLTVPDAAACDKTLNALAQQGGQVQVPAMKTFFSERFGMVADRFGISWMVLVTPK